MWSQVLRLPPKQPPRPLVLDPAQRVQGQDLMQQPCWWMGRVPYPATPKRARFKKASVVRINTASAGSWSPLTIPLASRDDGGDVDLWLMQETKLPSLKALC